ncbi:GNAT family N-acetyltransferase [uncultured Pelagimonas sp.]|uniref:GNAT family N-acetyltransferase n=1 Tax=uncultured Pelagimonas sp. TaxID=1618102 RepID=UPI00263781A5|nr:GNAT family N-acetyltransferase [uncultured Pelagimonas sp.]
MIDQSFSIAKVVSQDAQVDALLARHFADMRAGSPEESCHVVTADTLRDTGAHLFALHDKDGAVCAVGAFQNIDGGVELKSMHTAREARGNGYGRKVLTHLLSQAKAQGAKQAWLETGTAESFAPARALYKSVGFETCPPFGNYRTDPLSTFMTLVF